MHWKIEKIEVETQIGEATMCKASDLSTIDERTEMSSKLTSKDFRENSQRFRETPSISSAGKTPQ